MKRKKILDVTIDGQSSRFGEYLTALSQEFHLDWDVEVKMGYSPELQAGADAFVVDTRLSEEVLRQCALIPSQVKSLGVVDAFFNEEGGWLPRVLSFEALREVLVEMAREMDIRKPAFVTGDGARARIAASVLAHLGFSDIYMVSESKASLDSNIAFISRSYIGLRFHAVLASELTMLALSSSILINTVDLSQDKALVNDLSYFNFMKSGGLILDFNIKDFDNHDLLDEAARAELQILESSEVIITLAQKWLEHLSYDPIPRENLLAVWKGLLKNSPSV